jgi:hypothetical protein
VSAIDSTPHVPDSRFHQTMILWRHRLLSLIGFVIATSRQNRLAIGSFAKVFGKFWQILAKDIAEGGAAGLDRRKSRKKN